MAPPEADLSHGLPDDLQEHWRKIASPANVAVTASRGEWIPARHLLVMSRSAVEAITDPEQAFLNIQVTVRGGKSELLTKWLVVWALGVFAKKRILIVCATSDLAEKFSREARDIFAEWGPLLFGKQLRDDLRAVDEWGTTDGGLVRAVGVEGMITGYGFDLIIIDDPYKDAKEARSEAKRKSIVEWFSGTLRTRLEPGGTMLFTMARWGDDDLTGVVVEHNLREGTGDPWKVIKMSALAEMPPGEDPEEWRDDWGRKDGESFWPERWPAEVLRQIRESLPDPTMWDALYQQDPTPRSGNDFERANWKGRICVRAEPQDVTDTVRAWDLAGSENKGDWTVGALLSRTRDRRTVIQDIVRGRWATDVVEQRVLEAADRDGMSVRIRMETPKGDSGVTALHYENLLTHRDFEGWPVKGKKIERAGIMSGAHRRGRLWLVEADWNETLIAEFERFPNGRHDDQVDACSLAFNSLWEFGGDSSIYIPTSSTTLSERAPTDSDVVVWRGSLPQPAESLT